MPKASVLLLFVSVAWPTAVAGNLAAQTPRSWTTDDVAKQMTQLNAELTEAYLREDLAVLRKMLDDQHIHNNVFGKALTKDEFLKDIETGVLKFEAYETQEIKWHIDHNTAIATGVIRAKAIRDGRVVPATSFLFTRVFVKRGDAWKVLLFHNTMADAERRAAPSSN